MHKKLKEVNVERAGQRVAGPGCVTCMKTLEESFFSAMEQQARSFHRRSASGESLLSIWRVAINQALRTCGDRQAEVGASEDPWPNRVAWNVLWRVSHSGGVPMDAKGEEQGRQRSPCCTSLLLGNFSWPNRAKLSFEKHRSQYQVFLL